MAPLTDEDREFLNTNFERFGSAWEGGLDVLERDFDIEPEVKPELIRLLLTLRTPPAIRYTVEVTRKDGGMTHDATLPEGLELQRADLAQVEEILRRQGELWFVEPPNGNVRIVNVSGGIAGLQGKRQLETRLFGRRAVLYLRDPEGWGDWVCLWFDLDGGLEGVAWVDLPMGEDKGHWLSAKEVEFLEDAMRRNGDFGVYGSVQDGFRSLVTHMEVSMKEDDEVWNVSAYPRDGHGHFLQFPINKSTGAIGAAAAGHLVPEPEEFVDEMPEPEEE